MHDKHNEILDRITKQTFGPSALLAGSMGSHTSPGAVRIQINGRVVGSGGTFQEALQAAQTTMSVLSVAG